jgi:Tol biopolymer transport system component
MKGVHGISWAPDGHELIFSSDFGGSERLWRVSASGGNPELLAAVSSSAFSPAMSRQGNRLAFSESSFDTDIWRIQVPSPKVTGASATRIISSSQAENTPQYSPDGGKITFTSWRSGDYEIWVCDGDGQNPRRLTQMGGGTPRWSPDGQWVAFDSRPKEKAHIFVVRAEGGSPRCLTDDAFDEFIPIWSRDGRWIYFGSNRSGDLQIWKISPGGGRAVQVTRKGGWEAFESFDGKDIYYSKLSTAGIWKVPITGGDEALVFTREKPIYLRNWALASGGIYFAADGLGGPVIRFFHFDSHHVTDVASLDKSPPKAPDAGLAISPDGRWILCPLVEQDSSDIILVENFR